MSLELWSPSLETITAANMSRFIESLARQQDEIEDFPSLFRWSILHPEQFWDEIWDFGGVLGRKGGRPVEHLDRMPGARWFPEARLNFAENLLRFRDDQEALVSWNESGPQKRWTYSQLEAIVTRLAEALRAHGIESGDRIAGFLPNIPEAVAAMLATTSIGATWSSCSPDFGVQGVLDRFGQIEPRVLFAADGYTYAGKRIDCRDRLEEIRRSIPSLEKLVLIPYLGERDPIPGAILFDTFLAPSSGPFCFPDFPFDHPVYILYSSGTTGLPKCMVHGAGGTLLQHLKELVLHTDLKRQDTIFYFTTCGWMMWNWLVSSLAVGARVVLYDGSPFYPSDSVLWQMAERERISVFGTSAKYLALLEKKGVKPAQIGGLSALRTILSTGSPLLPESFDFVYRDVKQDVCLSSISGGTDIVSCFALGNPIGPVFRGEIQTRGLGMSVEIFDQEGRPKTSGAGELVCTRPFPSMPVSFWNDPDGMKYRKAYFDHYPGVWRHGDWAELTPHGGLVIHGRSDATLNPGGVRIGTAELYREVEKLDEVLESLVVGQEWRGDVRIVLFVKVRPGLRLSEEMVGRIRAMIRRNLSPHHVPARVIQVADLPRTISGKLTELAVRDVIHGRSVKNADALANPEALELFRDLPELQS